MCFGVILEWFYPPFWLVAVWVVVGRGILALTASNPDTLTLCNHCFSSPSEWPSTPTMAAIGSGSEGVLAGILAGEGIKSLLNMGQGYVDRWLFFDPLTAVFETQTVINSFDCPLCGKKGGTKRHG